VIVLAYLATVAVGLVVLAVALRRRPAPAPAPLPPAPVPCPALPVEGGAEIRVILAAAHQLAARLSTAA
jgi:Flp pilus assembly protein CpaB